MTIGASSVQKKNTAKSRNRHNSAAAKMHFSLLIISIIGMVVIIIYLGFN